MTQQADRDWLEPLALALEGPAYQLAVLLVEDGSVAQDIVQQAFVRVWRSPRTPRQLPDFRRWLYRAIVNLARDHHRRGRRWGRLRLDPPISADPAQEAEQRFVDRAVDQALRSLTMPEREAVYLRFFEDAPYEEVAQAIGRREGATRMLVHRALQKMRDRLGAEGLAPEGTRL